MLFFFLSELKWGECDKNDDKIIHFHRYVNVICLIAIIFKVKKEKDGDQRLRKSYGLIFSNIFFRFVFYWEKILKFSYEDIFLYLIILNL